MWSDGDPIDPSPTIDQAVNGGFPWLEIRCSRCKTPSDVDLAGMEHPPTTFVHDLAGRLRCRKCAKAGRRPVATLLQLCWQPRHPRPEADTCAGVDGLSSPRFYGALGVIAR
jgi:phage FluMu protein Com